MRASAGGWPGWLLLAATLFAGSPRCHAQATIEEHALVFQVSLGKVVLSEGLPAIQRNGQVFVPLAQFCDALEFPVRVAPQTGSAEGWFLEEGRTFLLNVPNREARIRDQGVAFDQDLVLLRSDDLYVESGLLSSWFPVDLVVDLRNLLLRVTSREPLPMEQRLERERRRERALRSRQLLDRPSYPRATAPYAWLAWPFFDVTMNGSYNPHASPMRSAAYSAFTTADLLGLGGQLFMAGDRRNAVSEMLVHAGRTDPGGGLLGPLRATEFSLGDVFTPQSALVARSRKGRGITLSSVPLDHPSEFDRTTVRGEGAPGWEVELYRNGALLDWQVISGDGRYEFQDVSVLYGLNLFGVVLYGPQGQRREETRKYYVGPNLIEPGKGYYRLAANQHQTDLIRSAGDHDDLDERRGDPRLSFEYERGLHRRLSAGVSVVSLPLNEAGASVPHTYFGTVIHSSLGAVYAVVDGATDVAGGSATQAALQTRWHGMNLLGEYGRFRNYQSERFGGADPMVHKARARLDGGVTLAVPLSWSLESAQERRESGRIYTDTGNRLSFSLRGVLLTNELGWRSSSGGLPNAENRITGQTLLNSKLHGVSVRTALQYSVHPVGSVRSVVLSADRRSQRFGQVRIGVHEALEGKPRVTYSVGWNHSFEELTLGVDGSSTNDGTLAAALSLSFSLDRDPSGGAWRLQSQPAAARSVAVARVVLDKNGDGKAGDGDVPVPGVRFRINRSPAAGSGTDERGEMLITGLSAYRTADVSVNVDSFEEPFWIVRPEGFSVLPRPGRAPVLEFVVEETGAIDGTVFIREGQEVREASAIQLQLLDSAGVVIRKTSSAFNGFYMFDMVPYGSYTVAIDRPAAEKLGLVGSQGIAVTIASANPIQSGSALILERGPGSP
jgi:hypothetical protein